MNIKELADLTGVNPETIRMYRNEGLLFPGRNPRNGYYEYEMKDLFTLLHIRKLRESDLSLRMIRETYQEREMDIELEKYQSELDRLDRQIEELQNKRRSLALTLEHLKEYRPNREGVTLIQAYDVKLDSYFDESITDPAFRIWMENAEYFTQTIGLSAGVLNRETLPEQIPVRRGLGTYESILRRQGFPMPAKTVCHPLGTYAAAKIELREGEHLRRDQLEPLHSFLKENGCQAEDSATAFLYRIDHSGKSPVFIYRLRVKVL